MKITLFLLTLLVIAASCHRKTAEKTTVPVVTKVSGDDEEEILREQEAGEGPTNSAIVGRVVEVSPVSGDAPCDTEPCRAHIMILAVSQMGSGYHGQFNAGDVIEARFEFTLSPTKALFPELNEHLPGLIVGSIFEAEVHEHAGREGSYSIQMYEVKQ